MTDADYDEFRTMLDCVCSLLSRAVYKPSAMNTAMWFRALAAYSIDDVRAAFDAHVADPQRGRFVPVPADLIAQLQAHAADDGRPGPEEAWSIAAAARDERATVVWTPEIAQAWGVARPVLAGGDEVGARMAFREAYTRMLATARTCSTPTTWQASLGHDAGEQAAAIREAARLGRVVEGADVAAAAVLALPPPGEVPLLLTGDTPAPAAFLRALAATRARLVAKADGRSADVVERERTAALRRRADEAARAYAEAHGIAIATPLSPSRTVSATNAISEGV